MRYIKVARKKACAIGSDGDDSGEDDRGRYRRSGEEKEMEKLDWPIETASKFVKLSTLRSLPIGYDQ